jgi:hypothetical protein
MEGVDGVALHTQCTGIHQLGMAPSCLEGDSVHMDGWEDVYLHGTCINCQLLSARPFRREDRGKRGNDKNYLDFRGTLMRSPDPRLCPCYQNAGKQDSRGSGNGKCLFERPSNATTRHGGFHYRERERASLCLFVSLFVSIRCP